MDDITSCPTIEVAESPRAKLSARVVLAALVERRISITEIQLTGEGSQHGGGHADVEPATFVRKDASQRKSRKVAVKKFRLVSSDEMTEEMFLRVFANELHVVDKLSHPNIVEIIGFVEDVGKRIAWLVVPWEVNGNLREFLGSGEWDIPERISLVKDTALGLEYLHTREPPICHGDLKSLNILVNSSHRALITDFGSARILKKVHIPGANPTAQSATTINDTGPDGMAPKSTFQFPMLHLH